MLKDIVSGLIFIAIGGFFFLFSFDYQIGSISMMGPGFFPMMISGCLVIVGLAVIIKGKFWRH